MNNEKTKNAILNHFKRYPKMQLQDLFKFLHQSSFGCEHFVSSQERALEYLKKEALGVRKNSKVKIDKLDGDFSRLPLGYLTRGLSVETLAKLFFLSAQEQVDGQEKLQEKLNVALQLIKEKALPFDESEFLQAKERWKQFNFSAVHHSHEFRKLYTPSYRVVNNYFITYLPLFTAIDKLIKNTNVVLAIEGGCASGKTTLTNVLQQIYDCAVFHVDDFFLQPHQRTEKRLSEVGGNFDRERLMQEVLIPLKENQTIKFRKFDCSTNALSDYIIQERKPLTVIEGVYSMHPELSHAYDISLFLSVSKKLQKSRILKRNPKLATTFFKKWIPLENAYFTQTNAKNRCDLVIKIK